MGSDVRGRLAFGLLGPLELRRDGRPVALGGERQRALLAVLLVRANELVRVEELVDQLFGEQRSEAAVGALRVAISRLRRVLKGGDGEDGILQSRAGGYVLAIELERLDALVFDRLLEEGQDLLASGDPASAAARLREALGLWRGPALTDVSMVESLQPEIRRLEGLRLVAEMERIDAELALGHAAELVAQLESLVAAEPLQERLRGQLMLALYRAGRQSDALAVYRQTSELLRDQLGLEPIRELRELERSILHHDTALELPPRAAPSASTKVTRLLEREAELQRARLLLDQASKGVGSVTVVEGPPGIGKSELLAAMAADAKARGFGTLRARASEFEQEIAFGVARQLFEPMLRSVAPEERRRLLDGVARLGARALGVEAEQPLADQFAAIHGLFWLCANRAERGPVVVAVDDLQWIDDPSLAWLGYVARRVGDLPLLLVLGLRSDDAGGRRAELAQLVGDGAVQQIALAPLSAPAVGAIARTQLDAGAEESFCAAVRELSGGNPLFVRELLAAAREEGLPARGASVPALRRIAPTAVGTSVLARLGRLGGEAVALARAVAVLGDGAEVGAAARLAELDPVTAELTADRLAAGQILAPVRPLEFFHPVIGAAILEDIGPGARRVAHRRAATLLDHEGEGELARVAAHLLACGPAGDAWVVQRLSDAARVSLDRGAPEIAASYARRALSEPPAVGERAALLLLLGAAEWRAGQPEAIAHLEQALAAADGDPVTLIGTVAVLAPAYRALDRTERAVEVLERSLATVGAAKPLVALALEASIVVVGMTSERTAPAAVAREEALRGRLDLMADAPVEVLAVLAFRAARLNRAGEAEQLVRRAVACTPWPPPAYLWNNLVVTLALVECYEDAQQLCERLLAVARERSAVQETVAMTVSRAWVWSDCGALADAEADARWALERAEGVRRIQAVTELVRVLIERDALEEAEHELDQARDLLASASVDAARLTLARGLLHVARGHLQQGFADFLECGQRYERLGLQTLSAVPWRVEAALTASALGNIDDARRLAGDQLELARALDRPRTLGISLRACGLVEGGERGLELLGDAVQTLERSHSPVELARALSDYGAALRRAGRRVHARTQLERALDLAHYCDARRIANRARGELIAAGAKPRRDAITGRDALTASELRVARLAAEGLTNREIAQTLFVTSKTVKAHLSRVYRKLEITRRRQLAGALDNGDQDATAAAAIT